MVERKVAYVAFNFIDSLYSTVPMLAFKKKMYCTS